MNKEPRDPLEKVSSSLRRAVNVNRTRESDLRSKVSTLQREHRESMNTWSLKQEKFLKAKLKMMPAIKMVERRETKDTVSSRPRKMTLTHGVKPVTMNTETRTNTPIKDIQLRKSAIVPSDLRAVSKYPNPLPPLVSSSVATTETPPQTGFYLQQTGKLEELSTTDQQLNKFPKKRRITEYKSPVHEYLYGNREEEQRVALRQRISVHELQNAATLARKVSCYGARKMEGINEEDAKDNGGQDREEKDKPVQSISSILPKDDEQGNRMAVEKWRKIRESLSTIAGRQKKKDISKMSMLELTSLFEGIRDCRYLRVGNHTSYRGDSVDSNHCRCIACTVADKTKLRNNLSASD